MTGIDEQAIRDLVDLWFASLANRRDDVLVGMCNEDVVIRPFLARQPVDAVSYHGHHGIRQWVGSLDDVLRIDLELKAIEITGEQSAIVAAEVWFEREGSRTGGMTWSVWRFDSGKLSEAVGYGSLEEARDAEERHWL